MDHDLNVIEKLNKKKLTYKSFCAVIVQIDIKFNNFFCAKGHFKVP